MLMFSPPHPEVPGFIMIALPENTLGAGNGWPIDREELCRCTPPAGGGGNRNPDEVLLPADGGGAREKDVAWFIEGRC